MNNPMQINGGNGKWELITASQPPDGFVVETKIHDKDGCRNEGTLKRSRRIWFLPDGSMYVYYTPTHWRPVQDSQSIERSLN